MQHARDKDLDTETFKSFAELMGDNLAMILTRHFETADGYLNNIKTSLEASDFATTSRAAHPLKSSCQQIGAFKVAEIAKEIELIASKEPDIAKLKILAEQLEIAHRTAEALLKKNAICN